MAIRLPERAAPISNTTCYNTSEHIVCHDSLIGSNSFDRTTSHRSGHPIHLYLYYVVNLVILYILRLTKIQYIWRIGYKNKVGAKSIAQYRKKFVSLNFVSGYYSTRRYACTWKLIEDTTMHLTCTCFPILLCQACAHNIRDRPSQHQQFQVFGETRFAQ